MFEGVFVPHITPFDEEEKINEEMLRELVHYFADAKLNGLVTLGSNGEFPYLSFEEKLKVLKIVREESSLPIIAGVAENSTRETIKLAKEAWDIGVDGLLIAPPYYFKPNVRELFAHYSRIAYEVEAPILLYNVPKFTTINIDIDVVEKLVEEHSNIVGIKDSSGSIGRVAELIRRVGGKISILAGTADLMYPSWVLGAHGAVVAVANVAPRLCVELYNAFREQRYQRARRLQLMINYLNEVVVKKYNQISAIKEAMRMCGLEVGYPRMPALPLDEKALEDIEKTLIEIGLI
ncbi:MAG: 4-hydroxy-tetrahydrodipicolinate synthase [Thermococcus sp.]|uniref:4-hydroxy-tetrahydrodipicolinate synthase n=1 Tax=Thermococcus sp. TaxID=35749 RepID=UPI000F2225D3|nr:4-hydroxy-tetrahydrodipicolinate synthase [Thermococcus sp.]MCD6139746.1 4-hydroxy-tetrahydrodipicolinate synthase [Thermococcus sp.]MCD6143213.1 4-hydroxy-tetrahydrodipicolinate synthase [Thermococcus sp.]RLF81810.1 MAG: 4-hydroxy-tetrahydrodipicolinate synthase [Thermococci archaeon]